MDMMVMGQNLPAWVTPVAWAFLVLAVLSAGVIVADIYGRGRRQPSRAMEIVWVVSALYLGPVALWTYAQWGRPMADAAGQGDTGTSSARTFTYGLPGGAASAVAHVIGVPLVALTGWTIAGLDMWAMVAVIAALALLLLFGFEYRSRAAATAKLPRPTTATRAAVVAAATIVAFDIGMVGWMVVLHLNGLMPSAGEVSFVFLMQIGVVVGLATAFPVISQLARRTAVPVAV